MIELKSIAEGDKDAIKKKIETLYSKINTKYPDATPLVAPWKDDGKSNAMNMQRKTLLEHFNDEQAEDLLEDWQDVYICALTGAMFDAFTIGDQPQADISEALDDFKELVLSKFVTQALDCNLSQYLSDNGYSYTPGLSQMLYGSDESPYYGYMSRRSGFARKAGKPISAANQGHIDDHVADLHDKADNAIAAMKQAIQHVKAIHAQADTFADTMSNSDKTELNDDDKQDGKSLESALKLLQGLRTNR